MTRTEKLLIGIIGFLLIAGIIVPILLFWIISDKALAAQIGDTIGGTTAPFVSTCAILIVFFTYYYQKRNDKKNYQKEFILENFKNLQIELEKLSSKVTNRKGDNVQEVEFKGRFAIKNVVEFLNAKPENIKIVEKLDAY